MSSSGVAPFVLVRSSVRTTSLSWCCHGWAASPPVAAPGSHLPQLLLVLLDPARPTTSWSCDVKKKALPKAMRWLSHCHGHHSGAVPCPHGHRWVLSEGLQKTQSCAVQRWNLKPLQNKLYKQISAHHHKMSWSCECLPTLNLACLC